jgi:hypothetical protein
MPRLKLQKIHGFFGTVVLRNLKLPFKLKGIRQPKGGMDAMRHCWQSTEVFSFWTGWP